MARVYSTRFLFAALADDENTSYVVPDGFVAVLRCVTTAQTSAGAGGVVEVDLFEAGGVGVSLLYLATTGASSSVLQELRVVMNAGDTLLAQNDNEPTQTVTASGYLLSLP